jgi:hypothetical protein
MAALFTALRGYSQASSAACFSYAKKYQNIKKFQAATLTNEFLECQRGING